MRQKKVNKKRRGILFEDGALEIGCSVVLSCTKRRLERLELCLGGVCELELDDWGVFMFSRWATVSAENLQASGSKSSAEKSILSSGGMSA